MYYYIFDIFTGQKKYEKQLMKIEGKLAELGISGKIFRLNILKNLHDIISEAEESGVENIIAVGNDQTLSKLVNLIIDKKIVTGIIPLGEPNILADSLGIKNHLEACQIISARKITKLDVGKINRQYFIFSVEPANKNVVFDFKNYNINPIGENKVMGVYNINIDQLNYKSNPSDGIMEAVFAAKNKSWWQKIFQIKKNKAIREISVFPTQKLTIKHKKKPVQVRIDRQRVLKTPLEIEVLPKKLNIIVGKDRIFK